MIANLIYTLMLALSVASGTDQSETCNAFKHVEERQEKPIQRATEQVTLYDLTPSNFYSAPVQAIGQTPNQTPNQTNRYSEKYYLDSTNTPAKANSYNQYVNIYNSMYLYRQTDSNTRRCTLVACFQIDNYTPTALVNLQIAFSLALWTNNTNTANNSTYYNKIVYKSEDYELSDLFDRQLTTYDSAYNYYNELNTDIDLTPTETINNMKLDTWTQDVGDGWYMDTINTNISIPYLEKHSNVQIVIGISVWNWKNNNDSQIYLMTSDFDNTNKFKITGYQEQIVVNQEIIDMPNLMFTILTLPFAWYSTAFNLTIFPGTPYQLNFGNLVLTIIAALMLLYLIKKILK